MNSKKKKKKSKRLYISLPFGGCISTTNECCHKIADSIKAKDEDVRKYVSFEKGEAVVDWEGIRKIQNARRMSYHDDLYEGTLNYLTDLDVLTVRQKDNYALFGCNILLNPRKHILELYFTRKKDAEKYREVNYSNAMYDVTLVKMCLD